MNPTKRIANRQVFEGKKQQDRDRNSPKNHIQKNENKQKQRKDESE